MAEQFAAKQRAKELATKGNSKIAPPPSANKKKKKKTDTGGSKSNKSWDECSVSTFGSSEGFTTQSPTSSSKVVKDKNAQRTSKALMLTEIQVRIINQELNKQDIRSLIEQTEKLAHVRLESGNNIGAALSMKKIRKYQADYERLVLVIHGLEQLCTDIEDGLTSPICKEKQDKILATNAVQPESLSNDELITVLEKGNLIPEDYSENPVSEP